MLLTGASGYIASQLLHSDDLWSVTYVGHPEVGRYLKAQIFAPGALYPWNELAKHATGAPLTPKAFSIQFVGPPPSS